MSTISCAVMEIFVAVGESYWRCVSCQLQFSRQASIDEHITLKHGGSQLYSYTLTSNTHAGVSLLPLSSPYQGFNTKCHIQTLEADSTFTGHQPHISPCLIPEVVKVNLDVSSEEKTSKSDEQSFTSGNNRQISELYVSKNIGSLNFQYNLTNQENERCRGDEKNSNSSKITAKDNILVNNISSDSTLQSSDSALQSSDSALQSSDSTLHENTMGLREESKLDCDYNADEAEKGNRSLLNSMLSLLEKSMDMDDINGVIQNWDSMNPELFEQQLLNSNSELSPHSLHPGCSSLDPSDNQVNAEEDHISLEVESINSHAGFFNDPDVLIQSSLSEVDEKRNIISRCNIASPIHTDISKLFSSSGCDNNQSKSLRNDTNTTNGLDVNEGEIEKDDIEDDDDDDDEGNEMIVEFLKNYLQFSSSQCKLIGNRTDYSLYNLEETRRNSFSDIISDNLSVCEKPGSLAASDTGLSDSTTFSSQCHTEEGHCEQDITQDCMRVSTQAASCLGKMCLRQGELKFKLLPNAPRLFIVSSPSPLTRIRDTHSISKQPHSPPSTVTDVDRPNTNNKSSGGSYQIPSTSLISSRILPLQEGSISGVEINSKLGSSCEDYTEGMSFTSASDDFSSQQRKNSVKENDSELSFPLLSKHEKCGNGPGNRVLTTAPKSHLVLTPKCSAKNKADEDDICIGERQREFTPPVLKTQLKAEKHKHRLSNAILSLLQIKKLKSEVLAIMKNQHRASKHTALCEISSKCTVKREPNSLGRKQRAEKTTAVEKQKLKSEDKSKGEQVSEKWKVCPVCDRRFSTNGSLQRHIRVNATSTDTCKCKVCNKKFHSLSQLNVHIYKSHGVKGKPICLRCNARFANIRCLLQHVQKYQNPSGAKTSELQTSISPRKGKAWRCRLCGMVCLNQPKVISAHRCKGHQKKCNKCDKRFPTRSSLNIHMAIHQGSMYECNLCGQFFKNKLSRHYHKLMHESMQGEFLCQICGQQFEFQHKLTAHVKIHSKNKEVQPSYKCGDCGRHYKSMRCLRRHVDVDHKGIKDYQYKCEHCLQQFFSSWQLRDHIAWHHFGEKPYHCQYCGKGFVCRPTLVRHQRKEHTGVKPHKCHYCKEAFVDKRNLDNHEAKVHTRLFPFVCTQCGKGFVHGSSLRTHQVSHTNSRPHQCHICGNGFTKASHLKRHTSICMKKNNMTTASEETTLSLDMEHLPNIPPRPPSGLSNFILPQPDNLMQFPGSFLTQNL